MVIMIWKTQNKGKKIVITSINNIIKKFQLKDVILKIDCEGCEYDTINALYQQPVIEGGVIEYHYGYKNLIKKIDIIRFWS